MDEQAIYSRAREIARTTPLSFSVVYVELIRFVRHDISLDTAERAVRAGISLESVKHLLDR